MGSLYNDLASTALTLLTDKGQAVTFTRKTVSGFDPAYGKSTLTSETTFTGKGAAFNYSKSEIDGTVIQAGDMKLITNAITTTPTNGDTVTVNSEIFRVMNVEPLEPAGTVVIYKIQIRR